MNMFRSLYNFRDLGGLKTNSGLYVRKQLLYRSNALCNLNKTEQQQLIDDYGIKTVIDLRSERERLTKPDLLPKGITYFSLAPISLNAEESDRIMRDKRMSTVEKLKANIIEPYSNIPEKMMTMMRSFVSNPINRDVFARMLSIYLNCHTPILLHCTTGKDRAGFGTAILLAALDVPLESIYKDYLFSNVMCANENERKMLEFASVVTDEALLGNLKSMLTVSEAYLDAAMDEIKRRYDDMQGFLTKGLFFNIEEQKKLQMRYIELL